MKIGDIFGAGEVSGLIKEVIQRVAPDKEKAAEMELKLAELEQSGELSRMTNETELFKTEVDDRKSARLIHTSFTDILAVTVLGGAGYLLSYILVNGVNKDIDSMTTGMIIQVAITAITMVLGYYFGSSSGSKSKNEAIAAAIKK